MPLHVFTARISYGGPDRLDITRKSAGPEGLPFAPSWRILGPALDARRHVAGLRKFGCHAQASSYEQGSWDEYVRLYTAEMRESYRRHRPAWDALLARERVVLLCYCSTERCHRRILAEILVKLGAVDEGEFVGPL